VTQTAIDIERAPLCQRCRSRPGIHNHHRKRRSQGGGDEPDNLVLVCLECHQWIHDHPRDAAAAGWLVLSWQEPSEVEAEPFVEEIVHDHADLAPGETCPTCHRKVPVKREKQEPRNRVVVSFKVPKDVDEDGVALWDEMIQLGRELLCERMGWEDDVPVYNVAMVLVAQGLEAVRADA
jgi:hypothetical protein